MSDRNKKHNENPAGTDEKALIYANLIAEIYSQPSVGGDVQRRAKVQCLLVDLLGNSYRRGLREGKNL